MRTLGYFAPKPNGNAATSTVRMPDAVMPLSSLFPDRGSGKIRKSNREDKPMRRIASFAVCLGLAACLGLFASPALAQSKAEIQQLNDQWAAAFTKGDAAAVAAMYTEDAYVLPAGAAMVKGRAATEALWR